MHKSKFGTLFAKGKLKSQPLNYQMKKIILFSLLSVSLLGIITAFNANKTTATEEPKIKWLTLEEAFAANQKAPRKILIDVYTGWCGWCKVMDKQTFTNPEVIKYVNTQFYAVKLNAEGTEDIKIGTTLYKFDAERRSHQAAIALLQGKMSYPTIVYLDETFNMIQPIPGYMDAKQFHKIITFIGDNNHKKEPFEKYQEGTYKEKFKGVSL